MSYADDTAIISADKTLQLAIEKMNKYLDKVYQWLDLNKLALNINKTVYIKFGLCKKSIPRNISVKLNDSELKNVESHKYLGVHMRWSKHVTTIVNKTRYLIFLF